MSYIVPMKKPICINCPFRSLDSCTLIYLMSDNDGEVMLYVNTMTTSPDCPLVEIPTPHGRLVDLDKMVDEYWDGSSMRIGKTDIKDIEEYDTVIEAEGSETE